MKAFRYKGKKAPLTLNQPGLSKKITFPNNVDFIPVESGDADFLVKNNPAMFEVREGDYVETDPSKLPPKKLVAFAKEKYGIEIKNWVGLPKKTVYHLFLEALEDAESQKGDGVVEEEKPDVAEGNKDDSGKEDEDDATTADIEDAENIEEDVD